MQEEPLYNIKVFLLIIGKINPPDQLECQSGSPLGTGYRGKANTTTGGRTCQKWNQLKPHQSGHPNVGDHNYCRNPDNHPKGVWCYTTDPYKRWELCSVAKCEETSNAPEGSG